MTKRSKKRPGASLSQGASKRAKAGQAAASAESPPAAYVGRPVPQPAHPRSPSLLLPFSVTILTEWLSRSPLRHSLLMSGDLSCTTCILRQHDAGKAASLRRPMRRSCCGRRSCGSCVRARHSGRADHQRPLGASGRENGGTSPPWTSRARWPGSSAGAEVSRCGAGYRACACTLVTRHSAREAAPQACVRALCACAACAILEATPAPVVRQSFSPGLYTSSSISHARIHAKPTPHL